jgi:hypothetical protein
LSDDLVDVEDLDQLDACDLRAVVLEATSAVAARALVGLPPMLRGRLLARLGRTLGAELERVPAAGDAAPLTAEAVQDARREIVAILCRMSRRGQVAFDPPGDILDLVA